MSVNSTDLIRFRRRRRKRWEILLEETGIKTRDQLRDAGFVNPLTGKIYQYVKPRKRRSRSRRRRNKRHKLSYGVKPSFKLRTLQSGIKPIRPGIFTKEDSLGRRIAVVPFTQIFESPVTPVNVQTLQVEKTWTESHPGPPYREGGPFTNIKIKYDANDIRGVGRYTQRPSQRINGEYLVYTGGFCDPTFAGDSTPFSTYRDTGVSPSTNALLPGFSQYGVPAYAKLRPTPARADLGQFIAELRELPRSVRDMKTQAYGFHQVWKDLGGNMISPKMGPKWVANQFLGYQFGWLPFLRDIENVIDITRNLDAYMQEVTRLNNTWVRKRADLDEGESSVLLSRSYNSGFYPGGTTIMDCCNTFNYAGTNCFYVSDVNLVEKYKVWAEGSFKFYRIEFDNSLFEHNSTFMWIQRHMTLYGIRVTPSLIYRITPWSWLVDMLTRIGDNIHNISGMLADSVVSKYMYVMHHKVRDVVQNSILNTWDRGPVSMSWTRRVETKQRDGQLSPFGFGVLPTSLSAKQISILAALGISRFG